MGRSPALHQGEVAPPLFEPHSSSHIQQLRFSDVVQNYLSYYASGTSHTARAKKLDLQHFVEFLSSFKGYSKSDKLKMRDWDHSSVQRFVDESLRKGESPATVARRLATLKHMGRSLAERVAGFVNPAKDVKSPKISIAKPKAVSRREISAIQRKAAERRANKSSFIRIRNEMIVHLLLDTGIRADEVRIIKRGQLEENLQWLKNVRTKGRRFRNVYLTSVIRATLREYLKNREHELKHYFPKLSKRTDTLLPLFPSFYNATSSRPESFLMGAKTIWRAVHECSAHLHLHPHLLRHSFALELLKHSNDIRLVSQALGHSDVKITMRYTERKDEEVAQALEGARRKR